MNMKKLKEKIKYTMKKYEEDKKRYKDFIENYKIGQSDYLLYVYFTCEEPENWYYEVVNYSSEFIYNLLITEKNFNKNEADELAEELSEEFYNKGFESPEEVKDESIKKFVNERLNIK